MAELLLELLSEEIPARMQSGAAEHLRRRVCDGLDRVGLSYSRGRAFATPRRLALVIEGLPKKQPDRTEEKKGPRVGSPERALQGFVDGNGLASLDQAEIRETGKGRFYFAVKRVKGRATSQVLPQVIVDAINSLPWPKSMRWANTIFTWVRPLHSVLAVLDGTPLQQSYGLGDRTASQNKGSLTGSITIEFGNTTRGHRFLAPKAFRVKDFADYQAKLKKAKVILDPAERRAAILRQAKARVSRAKLALEEDPLLLDEVTSLVEWPLVLIGKIDERFMDLPPEVLATSMRAHQKYLPLRDETGALANRFLLVADMETADRGKAITAGNERVLRARLADARFFWDQDRKRALESRVAALDGVVFHAKLGSLREKVERIAEAARRLAEHIPGANRDLCRRAGYLAKADLVTDMVGEFPELQGVMGRYYALHDREPEDVARAIAEHYAPKGPNDACPSAPVSVAVALADKIDTLFGFFAIDETPTGSKDPYALRRAALGVIRLIVENRLRIPLRQAFENAWHRGPVALQDGWKPAADKLLDFFADRLKVVLRDQGVRHDLIAAVFAVGGEDDLVRLLTRVAALEKFLASDDGANLLIAYRRAANIVGIEEKRDQTRYDAAPLTDIFQQDEEQKLHASLAAAVKASAELQGKEDFSGAMLTLARLRASVDRFFDRVTVNCDDARLRANRLRLLSEIRATLSGVADFSKIEG